MSKSLKRVTRVLCEIDPSLDVIETGPAKTALAAAEALGCHVDQIAKSIIFQGAQTKALYLFVTPGGQSVLSDHAENLAGEPLQKADAATIRKVTGFAIGGVSPVGHINPIKCFFEHDLMNDERIYAAAGTPNHVFAATPVQMVAACAGEISVFSK